jgi:hypothetical protein
MDTSRYAEYSLDDLRDVERRIDRERFPERYAALMAEIERRKAGAPQVLPSTPEPAWHARVREIYDALFGVTIALSMICALIFSLAMPVAHALIVNHATSAPTSTRTVPISTGQGKDHRTVYITPGESARLKQLGHLATFGILTVCPILFVVGLVAHALGIRIFDPRKEDSS